MDEANKNKWIKRIVTLVCDLVLAGVIAYWRFSNQPADYEISALYALSDGFFIVGFANLGFGALLWIGTTGIFDIISYGFKSLLYLFTLRNKDRDEGGYYEYKVRKAANRKAVPFETLWIGAGMIIVGIVFYILWRV